jgi:acyl dehydratase
LSVLPPRVSLVNARRTNVDLRTSSNTVAGATPSLYNRRTLRGAIMPETTVQRTGGLFFDEFEEGYSVVSPGRTITEHDVCTFAGLSGDYNPLHTDAEFSRDTMFGERIAHGMLGLSAATGLASRLGFLEGTAMAFLGLDWKFRNPILLGDTIRAVVQVSKKRHMPAMGGGVVTFDVRVVNQNDEVVQKGKWNILIKDRSESADSE